MSEQLPDGEYVIVSTLDPPKVLEICGGQANDGTAVDLGEDKEEAHQRWLLTQISDEGGVFYTIRHPNSSMVMEAPGDLQGSAPVVMRDYHKSDDLGHRQWIIDPVSDLENVYTIINRHSRLAIDVNDANVDKGEIRQWTPWNHPDGRQRWKLIPSSPTSKPQPELDAKTHFSEMDLVLKEFGYNKDAGNWTNPRHLVDVTGDGRADIVGFGSQGVWVSRNIGDGKFDKSELVLKEFGSNKDAGNWTNPRHLVDVTGDGRADIVGFGSQGVWVSRNIGDGKFDKSELVLKEFGSNKDAGNWTNPRHLVDVTGDGRADIVGFGSQGVWVSRNIGDGKFDKSELVLKEFGSNKDAGNWTNPRHLVDVTGDGRADIVGFGSQGVWVSRNIGDGKFDKSELVLKEFGSNKDAGNWTNPRHLVDVTGDGRADIVGFGSQGVWVSRNIGDGKFDKSELVLKEFGSNKDAGNWTNPRHLVDVTGDGRADIVGFGSQGVWVSRNIGDGKFDKSELVLKEFGSNKDAGGWTVERDLRFLVDVTGDGRADVVGFGGPGVYVSRNLANW